MVATSPQRELSDPLPNAQSAALILAHPGHEIRVHGWMSRVRPWVFVLTDGSGGEGHPRIESTRQVLAATQSKASPVFGRLSDRAAYQWILENRVQELEELTLEIASALETIGCQYVVSDAIEGFNPVHDLCNVIAAASVAKASLRTTSPIVHYDFLLEAAPDARIGSSAAHFTIDLSDLELARKLDQARGYEELRSEVDAAVRTHGVEAFRREVLYRASRATAMENLVGSPPAYEAFGERRVREGIYDRVLRFREHFEPMAQALLSAASSR